jgi:hypothetical protein
VGKVNSEAWRIQGQLMGSTFTVKDWHDMTNNGATSNPGSVQARIDRTLAKEAANKAMECVDVHTIDPIVYGLEYNAAMTKALNLMFVG